ncbi:MAG TPA: CsbD family protein [Acidimicrobiales bacterium]|nr:CsbD family protein [Acidimicrobiales bacterium]
MGQGDADELKGRAKEALGDLTDDEGLEREGKVDRATGGIKEKIGDLVDKVRDLVQRRS